MWEEEVAKVSFTGATDSVVAVELTGEVAEVSFTGAADSVVVVELTGDGVETGTEGIDVDNVGGQPPTAGPSSR